MEQRLSREKKLREGTWGAGHRAKGQPQELGDEQWVIGDLNRYELHKCFHNVHQVRGVEPDLHVTDMGGRVFTYNSLHLEVTVLVVMLDHLHDPLTTLCP